MATTCKTLLVNGGQSWRTRLSFALAILLAVALACPTLEAAYRRRRGPSPTARAYRQSMINAAQAQISAGKQVLSAAEAKGADADVRLNSALTKLRSASEELKSAKKDTRELAKQLKEVEKEILADEPADSEYGLARAALDDAKAKLTSLEKELLSKPEVEAKLKSLSGPDLSEAKAKIFDASTEHTLAKLTVTGQARQLEQIVTKVYHEHEDWNHLAEALADAHKEESQAKDRTVSSGASKLDPAQDLRKATNAAAAARNAIAQGEAVLKRLGGSNNNNNKNKPNNKTPTKSSAKK